MRWCRIAGYGSSQQGENGQRGERFLKDSASAFLSLCDTVNVIVSIINIISLSLEEEDGTIAVVVLQ